MLIVHVHVKVIPDGVDAFREASLANARASVQEPGVARFDVIQQDDDLTRFELIEIYRTPEAAAAHKATAHYAPGALTASSHRDLERSRHRHSSSIGKTAR